MDNSQYRLSTTRAGVVMGCLAAAPIGYGLMGLAGKLTSPRAWLLAVPVLLAYVSAGWFAAEPPSLRPSIKAGGIAGIVAGTALAIVPVMLGVAFGSLGAVLVGFGAALVGAISQVPLAHHTLYNKALDSANG